MKRTSGAQDQIIANAEYSSRHLSDAEKDQQIMDLLGIIRDLDNRLDIAVNSLIALNVDRDASNRQKEYISNILEKANPYRKSDNK